MDVGKWLQDLGLAQYGPLFREHEIDAEVLPELSEVDLEKLGLPLGAPEALLLPSHQFARCCRARHTQIVVPATKPPKMPNPITGNQSITDISSG